jgi:hypothetical protein
MVDLQDSDATQIIHLESVFGTPKDWPDYEGLYRKWSHLAYSVIKKDEKGNPLKPSQYKHQSTEGIRHNDLNGTRFQGASLVKIHSQNIVEFLVKSFLLLSTLISDVQLFGGK